MIISEMVLELQCYIVALDKECYLCDFTIDDLIEFIILKGLVDKYEMKYSC